MPTKDIKFWLFAMLTKRFRQIGSSVYKEMDAVFELFISLVGSNSYLSVTAREAQSWKIKKGSG